MIHHHCHRDAPFRLLIFVEMFQILVLFHCMIGPPVLLILKSCQYEPSSLLMFFSLLNLLPSCNHLFIMQVLSEGEQHTLASTPAHPAGLYGKRGFFFSGSFHFQYLYYCLHCISYANMLLISWEAEDPCYSQLINIFMVS